MPQDHSSRWSAAASPGGLIGLVLTILALMALAAFALSLTSMFELGLNETVLIVALGVSVFLAVLLVYLLIAYVTISYKLDTNGLTIRCGVWSARIPYEEMEAVGPVTEILGEQDAGWQPYWPGYYAGVRNTDEGKVRVVATLPPRHQIAISRSDGETFSISPERPLLFMEELARWHEAHFAELEESDPETTAERPAAAPPGSLSSPEEYAGFAQHPPEFVYADEDAVQHAEPTPPPEPDDDAAITAEQPSVGHPEPSPEVPEPAPAPSPAPVREEDQAPPAFGDPVVERDAEPAHVPEVRESPDQAVSETPPEQEPVFGTSAAEAESPPPSGPRFGFTPPEVEPSYLPAGAEAEQSVPADEIPTNQFEVWFPEPPADEPVPDEPSQQVADPNVAPEHQPATPILAASTDAPFVPPQPVISPAGTPRREVIQPLSRVYRAEPQPTSPAIRPMLHRDPVSLGFIGFGLVAGIAMSLYILVQYDDIPPSLTLHWNAEGMPGRIGEPREIWILPLIAGIVLLANIGLAWSIAQFDRFAARLTLSSTVLTHIVLWIALLMIL